MRLPLPPRVLMLSGAGLLFVVWLAVAAPSAAAGSTWQTATDVSTPLVDANLTLAPGEVQWFAAAPGVWDYFRITVSTDSPVDLEVYHADQYGQPNVTFLVFAMDGAGNSTFDQWYRFSNTSARFVALRENGSTGANLTLSLGPFAIPRLVPGTPTEVHLAGVWLVPDWTPHVVMLDNALVGGQDGLWDINVTVTADNSSVSGFYASLVLNCIGLPYCGPPQIPANYARHVWTGPGQAISNNQLNTYSLGGNGSSISIRVADSSQGVMEVNWNWGYTGPSPPNNTTYDITLTMTATRGPLPPANADDYLENATHVTTHQPLNGSLSLDDDLVDWYEVDAGAAAFDVNFTLGGTTYNDGSARSSYLVLTVEAMLFDGNGSVVAAANNEIWTNSSTCIGCFAGDFRMHLRVPAGAPAGQPFYMAVRVTFGGQDRLAAIATYSFVARVPGQAPVALRGPLDVTMDEDTSTEIDVGSWFEDPDGDPLTYAGVATNGTVTLIPSFSLAILNLTPAHDGWGQVAIRVTARDGYIGQVAEVWVYVTVLPVNDAPRSDGVTRYLIWDQGTDSGPLDVADAFTDVDGDTLSTTLSLPAGFTSSSCGTGCFVVHLPDGDTFGNYSVSATATDPAGLNASVPVELVVVHVNRAPVLVEALPASPLTASHTAVVNLSATFSDPDGDPLTYQWQVDGQDQARTEPSLDVSGLSPGNHSARVTASDGNETARAFWLLVVTNGAPTLAPLPAGLSLQVSHNASSDFEVEATDPDGDPLTYAWWVDGVAAAGGGPTLTVDPFRVGAHDVRVTVSDGTAQTSLTWSVQSTDSPPELLPTPPGPTIVQSHNGVLLLGAGVIDPDGDPVTFDWVVDGKAVPGAEGATHGFDALTTGNHTVTMRATANRLKTEFTWAVTLTNAAPVLGPTDPPSGEVTVPAGVRSNFSASATDADDDPLAYAWVLDGRPTGQAGGTYSLGALMPAGAHTLRFEATDTEGASVSAEWTVTVEPDEGTSPPSDEPPSTPGMEAAVALVALAVALAATGRRPRRL